MNKEKTNYEEERDKTIKFLNSMKAYNEFLKDVKMKIGLEEYNKIVSEPVKGCKCGYIKEGDYNL